MPTPESFLSPAEREALNQKKPNQVNKPQQSATGQQGVPGLNVNIAVEDRIRELELMLTMFNQISTKYSSELQAIRQELAQRQQSV